MMYETKAGRAPEVQHVAYSPFPAPAPDRGISELEGDGAPPAASVSTLANHVRSMREDAECCLATLDSLFARVDGRMIFEGETIAPVRAAMPGEYGASVLDALTVEVQALGILCERLRRLNSRANAIL